RNAVVHRSIPSLPLDPRQPHAPKLITNPYQSTTLNLSLCNNCFAAAFIFQVLLERWRRRGFHSNAI
ncbi:MAG: hypothetical protein NTX70_13415, partial [Verrucomicrobia bacterium]|nr:hypothetical protein [Verrucomicrobiota bacterium]